MYCYLHKYLHLIGTLSTQGMYLPWQNVKSGMGQGSVTDVIYLGLALSECIFQTVQLIYDNYVFTLFEHGEYIDEIVDMILCPAQLTYRICYIWADTTSTRQWNLYNREPDHGQCKHRLERLHA